MTAGVRRLMAIAAIVTVVATACGAGGTEEGVPTSAPATPGTPDAGADPAPSTTEKPGGSEQSRADSTDADHGHDDDDSGGVDLELLLPAYLGAAAFQDVAVAESEGWVSTIDTLGCFEDANGGGMGVHWLNESLLDDELDPAQPEALVYELDVDGEVVGLVGHEYLVPFEAWTDDEPPTLFGLDLHEHPTLPFWILHAYLWKDNPSGMFNDWNPAVRMCPDGVAVFGVDLP